MEGVDEGGRQRTSEYINLKKYSINDTISREKGARTPAYCAHVPAV